MRTVWSGAAIACLVVLSGCGPVVKEVNQEGLRDHYAGRYVEAIGMFKTALEKDPGRPSTLYYMGRSYMCLAEERFRDGNARMARRNLDDAVYAFDRAIAQFPNYDEAIQARAKALAMRGEYDKSLKSVKQTMDLLGPTAKNKITLAQQYEQAGDFDNALLTYRQAVAIEPLNAWAHAECGRFYKRIDRRKDAVDELTRAYRLNPQESGVEAQLKVLGAWPPQ
ncbi:MAG: tetratricopeptide repeat protein [Phycisphaerae bacterium]|nr:tetratricopeptide repeat protein [Phycisphaerae bacterium]